MTSALIAVVLEAPNFLVIRSLVKLEKIVLRAIIAETIPAYETGTSNFENMFGHADPSIELGKPRLINAMYITAKRKETINAPYNQIIISSPQAR